MRHEPGAREHQGDPDPDRAVLGSARSCIRGLHRATTALQAGNPERRDRGLASRRSALRRGARGGDRRALSLRLPRSVGADRGLALYAYSTNSGTGNIQVLVSRDLVQWSIVGDGLAGLPAWAAPGATWAPAVFARGAGFVAYYTAREIASGRQCISVAVSASPAGPFVDSSTAPLVCQAGGSIDPSPFVDESGTAWLLWKSEATITEPPTIWSQPLSTDGLTLAGMPTPMLTPGQKWEGGVVEAPSMIRIAGRDYLFYSGNRWTTAAYAEGAVVCDGPAGPCRRIESGPVLTSEGRLAGPGGGGVLVTPTGEVWLAFHAFTEPDVGYPNSRTLHFATVHIVGGIPIVSPQ